MGIKLNVGISKKIGLPDYGSAGSQCNLEIELDNAALDRPEDFHRRVREAYAACRSAVEDELSCYKSSDQRERVHGNGAAAPTAIQRATLAPKTEYRNSAPPDRNDNRFPASGKQMEFIGRLSKGIKGLTNQKLNDYCQATYGKPSTQLSAQDASQLIDALKDAKEKGGFA